MLSASENDVPRFDMTPLTDLGLPKERLRDEAAPAFKAQEAQKAESDAAEMQMEQQWAPAATGTTTAPTN